ncbi:MAG: LptA/OstA family protein [Candidatus Omnitrophota bacterium]|jgi:hypothetical protein
MFKKFLVLVSAAVLFCSSPGLFAENILKTGGKAQPMTINGDVVEYSADSQEVTATGDVEIISGDTKLTCQKLTVNTQTKEGIASGHARLEDGKGVVEGERLIYNFQNKTGTLIDAQFRASPFFGRAKKIEKEEGKELVAYYGYATTCSFDRPHYRVSSKRINIIPGELIQTKDDYLYLSSFPLMYLANFNQIFDKPISHVSVLPGKRKDWGPYLLSIWEFNLANNVDGRAYLDYRNKLGWAEGVGLNYTKTPVGSGDIKFYFTNESSKEYPASTTTNVSGDYQRYLIRLRHKWDIDKQTNFVAQIYKIGDEKRKYVDQNSDFLQDYFYREFEKDSEPLTYGLFHHNFSYSSFDVLVQKRVNNWYNQIEKLPEVKYTLPSLQLGDSLFYFENNSTFATFNKKPDTIPVSLNTVDMTRLDSVAKVSLPAKVSFIWFTPFIKLQETIYDKGANNQNLPARTIFYAGADLSTKFYRTFNTESNLFGLDLNGLRHIITPTIGYSYNPEPTISSNKLRQIDSTDSLTSSNAATLELSNKLQTKRKNKDGVEKSVDLVDFKVSTKYAFAPQIVYGTNIIYQNNIAISETDVNNKHKQGASFSDVLFKLKLLPYSWLRFEGDATYKHSGVPGDTDYANYNHFSTANYDFIFEFENERSFSLGQRYARKGQNQITAGFQWRINPKWKFSIYERFNLKNYLDTSTYPNTYVNYRTIEQQFTLTRNLHCWDVELTWDNKQDNGTSIYLLFRLKAFPENEFGFNQGYNKPKSGA